MVRVFDTIGTVLQSDHVHEIVGTVKFFGFMTTRLLWQQSMAHMSLKDFEEAVKAAVHGRLLEVTTQNNQSGVCIPGSQKGTKSA
jgi:hypothetical protein